ncbi:Lipid-A-disaccharide synthase [Bacteroidales bacterium Barb4]|nr:Lipid-A-disaccharide synthase [Bacteroidales bacterium Barb4]
MKYYLIAGEASGDLHASNLMVELKALDKEAEFRFLGGDLMQAAGGVQVKHYRETAYMGFIPVLLHLPAIMRTLRMCKEDIRRYQPDAVILVDYPGFNLKIAKYVKKSLHLPVCYYISPKIWAWKKYRIKSIRRYIDRMYCILPFEKEFYQKLNYAVDYVGNPSVDSVAQYMEHRSVSAETFRKEENLPPYPIIALLAGSRQQEIKDNLPVMLEAASSFPGYQILVAGAPGIEPEYYRRFTMNYNVKVLFDKTYPILQHSQAALVTSGTATLETALLRVPQAVCYKTPAGKLVSFIFRTFFQVSHISLVNLIADGEVVQELFGERFTLPNIQSELSRLLTDPAYSANMQTRYDDIIRLSGNPGAARRTAELIFQRLAIDD